MFSNIGPGEVLVIVVVLIFLFGRKKLPELARGLGQSSREINKVKDEISQAISDITNDKDPKGGESDNA